MYREELANTVTHALGLLLSMAGLCVLVVLAAVRGDVWQIVTCSIYGSTLVFMYTASTLYHSFPPDWPGGKRVLRVIDHAAIFLLIAGSYTPFTLVSMGGGWGWTMFGLAWAVAILGVVLKFCFMERHMVLSVVLYLAMGWMALIAAKPLIQAVPPGCVALIFAGGLCYTLGVIFFAWERLPYNHAIWHLFVLAGSALHYFAVLFYVVV